MIFLPASFLAVGHLHTPFHTTYPPPERIQYERPRDQPSYYSEPRQLCRDHRWAHRFHIVDSDSTPERKFFPPGQLWHDGTSLMALFFGVRMHIRCHQKLDRI